MRFIDVNEIADEPVSHNPEIMKRVVLGRDELPGLRGLAQACLLPGQEAHAHMHPDTFEVFLVTEGVGQIRVSGEEHPLHKGVCVVVEPAEEHEVRNTGHTPLVFTTFGVRMAQLV